MEQTKKELIEKLEKISGLYQTTVTIQNEMEEFVPEDPYKRQVTVPQFPGKYKNHKDRASWEKLVDHSKENAPEQMEKAYERAYCPKEPAKPDVGSCPEPDSPMVKALKKKQGWIPLVAGFIAVCALLSGGLFSGEIVTVLGNLVVLGACGIAVLFFLMKYTRAKAGDKEVNALMLKTYEENKRQAEEQFKQDTEAYRTNRTAYNLSKNAFLKEYAAWREAYCSRLKEEAQIKEKLEADRAAGVNRIYEEKLLPAQKKLEESNDLITEEYLPVLHIIIELLKSGRAEDLKEAVNLYEEMVYRQAQLELQRQQEQQRRYEEEQRRRDEERRYQEEKRFRESQERQRRYEEEQRRSDEERRHREDMRAREKAESQRQYEENQRRREERLREEKAQLAQKQEQDRATFRQCQTCASNSHCSMAFRRPNCASYRPR